MTFVGITIGVDEIGVSVRVTKRTWIVEEFEGAAAVVCGGSTSIVDSLMVRRKIW